MMGVDDCAYIAAAAVPATEPLAEIDKGDGLAVLLGVVREIGRGEDSAVLLPVLQRVAARWVVAPNRNRIARGNGAAERRQRERAHGHYVQNICAIVRGRTAL